MRICASKSGKQFVIHVAAGKHHAHALHPRRKFFEQHRRGYLIASEVLKDGNFDVGINFYRMDVEFDSRRKGFVPPPPRYKTGVLAKYVKLVSSAAIGAVCG